VAPREADPAGREFEAAASDLQRRIRARAPEVVPGIDLDTMFLMFNLSRVYHRLTQDLEAAVHRPLGLTYPGFRVLFTILMAGPTEPSRLARLVGVSRPATSVVVSTLQRQGFVTRRRDSADRRVISVVLTELGEAVVREAIRLQHQRVREWTADLTLAQKREVAAVLGRLLLRRAPERPAPQPLRPARAPRGPGECG
jgi:DNA-binding MarR family transcriptional regulator